MRSLVLLHIILQTDQYNDKIFAKLSSAKFVYFECENQLTGGRPIIPGSTNLGQQCRNRANELLSSKHWIQLITSSW